MATLTIAAEQPRLPRKVCTCCVLVVQMQRVQVGNDLGWKCSNCWYLYTHDEAKKLKDPPEEENYASII